MKHLFSALCLLVLAAGCGKPAETGPPTKEAILPAGSEKAGTVEKKPFNIGDAEAQLMAEARLAAESVALPGVTEEPLVNAKDIINMNEVQVPAPYPPELWVLFKLRSNIHFNERPVAIRGRVLRDNQPISYFSTVMGREAAKTEPQGKWPHEFKVNVLAGLPQPPSSMLVIAELTLLLMPSGTDEDTVDPVNVVAPEEEMSVVLTNPVRIDFLAAPVGEAAAAGPADSAVVPGAEPAVVAPAAGDTPAAEAAPTASPAVDATPAPASEPAAADTTAGVDAPAATAPAPSEPSGAAPEIAVPVEATTPVEAPAPVPASP